MGNPNGKLRNPFDPPGRQMEYFRCGSRDHLADRCSLPRGKGRSDGGKKGGFLEDSSGYWSHGAVDGAYDYSRIVSGARRACLTMAGGEVYDEDGNHIPESYIVPYRRGTMNAEYESDWNLPAACPEYHCDWGSCPTGARAVPEVMHHAPRSRRRRPAARARAPRTCSGRSRRRGPASGRSRRRSRCGGVVRSPTTSRTCFGLGRSSRSPSAGP